MKNAVIAICVYNGARNIEALLSALREQAAPVPVDILVVDNNSSDGSGELAAAMGRSAGRTIRVVKEAKQGIAHARNRAIEEARSYDALAFIDADELPLTGWVAAALEALAEAEADCVGGRIDVNISPSRAPGWLTDELLAFLGKVDYGADGFWIKDRSTPVWSGNIAYRTDVFADGLRFDLRYNRAGEGVGGGEDAMMFRALLERGAKIRYCPTMAIEHLIDTDKLRLKYFFSLHYSAGVKSGRFDPTETRGVFGVPPYMIRLALRQTRQALGMWLTRKTDWVRQGMNAAYAIGQVAGLARRQRHDS